MNTGHDKEMRDLVETGHDKGMRDVLNTIERC